MIFKKNNLVNLTIIMKSGAQFTINNVEDWSLIRRHDGSIQELTWQQVKRRDTIKTVDVNLDNIDAILRSEV